MHVKICLKKCYETDAGYRNTADLISFLLQTHTQSFLIKTEAYEEQDEKDRMGHERFHSFVDSCSLLATRPPAWGSQRWHGQAQARGAQSVTSVVKRPREGQRCLFANSHNFYV